MHEQLCWLSEAECNRLHSNCQVLPSGRRGAYRVDNRQVISGIAQGHLWPANIKHPRFSLPNFVLSPQSILTNA